MTKAPSLSHSSLQILQSCPLRYQLSRIEGRSRKGNTRGLRRGKAFSDALENQDASLIAKAYDKYILEAVNQWLVDDLIIEKEIVTELYLRHEAEFGPDEVREVEFDYMIGDTGYRNHGFMDGVDTDESAKVKLVKEDKLLMMWSKSDVAALPMNGQVLRYLGAAKHLWPEYDIELQYRVTRYPGTYRKKDEGPREYAARVCDQVRSKKSPDLFDLPPVIRLSDPVVADRVKRYYADLELRVWEVEARKAKDAWPGAFGEACKAFGGCEFLPACKQDQGFEDLYDQREDKR